MIQVNENKVQVKLVRIGVDDAERLWKMQVEAFGDLYEKYQDTETSPAAEKFEKTDVADVNFMGLHESQSRFYENILGRNINFWKPVYGKLQELLPQFKDITLEQFEREINRVVPSFIRTEADELTYPLHILFIIPKVKGE